MAKGKRSSRPPAVKKPKQQRLPGTEDARIDQLEDLAEEYAEVRDARAQLTPREVDLKGRLLSAMKANKKEHYKRNGITIDVKHEKETVKVKVSKGEEETA